MVKNFYVELMGAFEVLGVRKNFITKVVVHKGEDIFVVGVGRIMDVARECTFDSTNSKYKGLVVFYLSNGEFVRFDLSSGIMMHGIRSNYSSILNSSPRTTFKLTDLEKEVANV